METAFFDRLSKASLKTFLPERDIDWSEPFGDEGGPAMPPELVSLYSLPVFDRLSARRKAHLARHEIASWFSIFIRFEDLLIRNLTRMVQRGDPLDPAAPYMLHEIEEEARLNRMFIYLIRQVGVGSYPLSGLLGAFEYGASSAIARSPSLFLTAVLAVEDLTDHLLAQCTAWKETHPTLRQVCRVHRTEEARHIHFAEALLRERYPRAPWVERMLVRYLGPVVISLIFDLLVSPSVYRRAGVTGSDYEGWKCWWAARSCQHRSNLRRSAAASLVKLLGEVGAIDRTTRSYWSACGLLPS